MTSDTLKRRLPDIIGLVLWEARGLVFMAGLSLLALGALAYIAVQPIRLMPWPLIVVSGFFPAVLLFASGPILWADLTHALSSRLYLDIDDALKDHLARWAFDEGHWNGRQAISICFSWRPAGGGFCPIARVRSPNTRNECSVPGGQELIRFVARHHCSPLVRWIGMKDTRVLHTDVDLEPLNRHEILAIFSRTQAFIDAHPGK